MAFLTPSVILETVKPEPIVNRETESRIGIIAWKSLTLQKVELAILHTGNTSPGINEIPALIIRKC